METNPAGSQRQQRRPRKAKTTLPRLDKARTEKRHPRQPPPLPEELERASGPVRLAATVFVQYGLIALAIRYVSDRNFTGVVIVNLLIAVTSWHITRGIARAHTRREQVAYVIGGTTGSVVAVYFS